MDGSGKTETVYSARFTERELSIFERITGVLEDIADAVRSEAGLEGGKSLFSTLNRALDQVAFHHEASTRHVDMSTRLNETYIDLLRKQIENQNKIIETQNALTKSIEEVKKAQAGQSSAIQSLDKRLKNIEGGSPTQQQKAPFRDGRNKPHRNGSTKPEIATPVAVPTTNSQNAKKDHNGNHPAPINQENSEASRLADSDLQEQVQKLSVVTG